MTRGSYVKKLNISKKGPFQKCYAAQAGTKIKGTKIKGNELQTTKMQRNSRFLYFPLSCRWCGTFGGWTCCSHPTNACHVGTPRQKDRPLHSGHVQAGSERVWGLRVAGFPGEWQGTHCGKNFYFILIKFSHLKLYLLFRHEMRICRCNSWFQKLFRKKINLFKKSMPKCYFSHIIIASMMWRFVGTNAIRTKDC